MKEIVADYVVVGAGSAGCVIAKRLCEIPGASVVLLEAGGTHHPWYIRMPSAFYMPMHKKRFNWGYSSEPEPGLNHRRLACPRGKGLGGSSSINGMVYVRGNPGDFDGWVQMGASGWSYDDVLPYFKKAQTFISEPVNPQYQGESGPLQVSNGQMNNPLYQTFLEAAQQAGYPLRTDLNGAEQEGFGPLPMTVAGGQRASVARCYLQPRPQNLTILSHFSAHKLKIENKVVKGLSGIRNDKPLYVKANTQLIVACGAIGSPALLQLSGIGNPEHLQSIGIPVQSELPGVGENLMDHLEVYVQQSCTRPVSLYKKLSPLGKARIGAQWLTTQSGLGATNHFEAGGFIRSDATKPYPDIQFHFLPAAMNYDGTSQASGEGFQAHVGPMLSSSRGHVRIRTSNPTHQPEIKFNYMSSDEDWRVFRQAIRATRDIFAQPAFDDYRGPELAPGDSATSDKALDAFIRAHAESAYHPSGTCRMGTDKLAVVDPQARVHGVENLRVVDASIFPRITNGNLNAPTIMVAEKVADQIKSEVGTS
ncbi:MAG: choline dehydrogenase [Pseudomonadota bacterium]